MVGRYRLERQPFGAVALNADTSVMTALANDYGYEELFARQVRALGQRGDILLACSISGRSPNLLAAAEAARIGGLRVWAMTGPLPTPLP